MDRVVLLGNNSALDAGKPLPGNLITSVRIPELYDPERALRAIAHDDGCWVRHSSGPPVWVESTDLDLAAAVAAHYGCPLGRPDDWDSA